MRRVNPVDLLFVTAHIAVHCAICDHEHQQLQNSGDVWHQAVTLMTHDSTCFVAQMGLYSVPFSCKYCLKKKKKKANDWSSCAVTGCIFNAMQKIQLIAFI